MQAVGHLDEHHAYILAHCQQKLAEVLGLQRCLVAENAAGYLCQATDEFGDLGAELLLDVLNGVVRVLDHVVEQGCAYRRGAESYLL